LLLLLFLFCARVCVASFLHSSKKVKKESPVPVPDVLLCVYVMLVKVLLCVVGLSAVLVGGVIPPGDFKVVLRYAQLATKTPKFTLAEGVHANLTARHIVDIRQATDYAAGHIKGAVNVPYAALFDEKTISQLPVDRPLLLVCYTGQSAAIATALLSALGYDVLSMCFGMAAWRQTTAVAVWSVAASQNIYGGNFEIVTGR
jgi:rhodanese-related sulfurtransferase